MKDKTTKLTETKSAIARWERKLKLAMTKLRNLHAKRLRLENSILAEQEKQAAAMQANPGRTITFEEEKQ